MQLYKKLSSDPRVEGQAVEEVRKVVETDWGGIRVDPADGKGSGFVEK